MKFGTIDIPNAVLLAPMEDVTDIPFRLVCKRLGADLMFTEFVNADGLVRNSKKTKQKMFFLPEERPFGIQIYGGEESSMEGAARMAEEFQPDLIDINAGCWVKKIAGRGAGSGLLRDLPRMQRIIELVVNAVKLPVTVKTRLGWDAESIQIIDVAKMVEDTGAKALTIHCRTREQGHQGEPDYSWIHKVKDAVSIPIIVNGGIDTASKANEIFATTGCDGVMIAQGAIHNPWIFREIKYLMQTGELLPPPTIDERFDTLAEHLQLSVKFKGAHGIIEFRKHYSGYLKGLPGIARLRAEMMQYTELQPILERLNLYRETLASGQVVEESTIVTA